MGYVRMTELHSVAIGILILIGMFGALVGVGK